MLATLLCDTGPVPNRCGRTAKIVDGSAGYHGARNLELEALMVGVLVDIMIQVDH